MMFAAAVGHRSGRATPSLRDAPQRQSMEIVRRETIYRNRNAVQTNPATSATRRGTRWQSSKKGRALGVHAPKVQLRGGKNYYRAAPACQKDAAAHILGKYSVPDGAMRRGMGSRTE